MQHLIHTCEAKDKRHVGTNDIVDLTPGIS